MPLLESEARAVRRELEKVLESPGFERNERLSRFLRFVVEGHLEGKDLELKESVIAVEVFGRSTNFDSRLDAVVRTEAVRLRARLSDVQLVRVHDDFPLWSGKFDRELTDVFAIQDEISIGIVNNLRLKLGGGRRRYETSVEACACMKV